MTRPIFTHGIAFGVGMLIAALFTIAAFSGPGTAPPTMAMASADSRDTSGLAAKLTAPVQSFLTSHRDDFASRAGGPMERLAVRWGTPIAVRETPTVLEYGLDEVASELGSWSLSDVIHWFASVAEKRGEAPPRAAREFRGGAFGAAMPGCGNPVCNCGTLCVAGHNCPPSCAGHRPPPAPDDREPFPPVPIPKDENVRCLTCKTEFTAKLVKPSVFGKHVGDGLALCPHCRRFQAVEKVGAVAAPQPGRLCHTECFGHCQCTAGNIGCRGADCQARAEVQTRDGVLRAQTP